MIFIEPPEMPFLDRKLIHLAEQMPTNIIVDASDCFIIAMLLLLIDTSLRVLIEVIRYNQATNRDCSIKNILFAIHAEDPSKSGVVSFDYYKRVNESGFYTGIGATYDIDQKKATVGIKAMW